MLFRELDEKFEEAKTLLTRAETMLSRCATNNELRDTVERLRATALDTCNTASKSQVSALAVVCFLAAAAAAATVQCYCCVCRTLNIAVKSHISL